MGVSGELCAVEASQPIEVAIRVMGEHDFSQISVTKSGRIIGSLNEAHLFEEFVRQPDLKGRFQDRQDVHHHAVGRHSSADAGAGRTRRTVSAARRSSGRDHDELASTGRPH